MRRRVPTALCAALIAAAGLAHDAKAAQTAAPTAGYPNKTIRFITGFLPGGVSDTIARVLAEKLGERLGQRVIIDGRPGAGGLISMELAAGANPDGYTWFLGTPVVNIGGRQQGRLAGEHVTHVGYDSAEIAAAVAEQLAHGPYPSSSIYHRPNASDAVVDVLASVELYTQKRFFESGQAPHLRQGFGGQASPKPS